MALMRRYPRPWLIYAGKLQERLDIELILELAGATVGTVLLAGPTLAPPWIGPLASSERIVRLGDVHYSRLPGLLVLADVAIVPHRVGDGEVGGDALKLYEYAAVGTRIVTTPIGGAERLRSRADLVVASGRQFVDAVLGCGQDDRAPHERVEAVGDLGGCDWRDRGDEIVAALQQAVSLSKRAVPRVGVR
jgi:glycosyltransferase involved in cell wall biosynthesis